MDYWQRRLPLDFKLFLSSALFYGVQGDVIQGHPVNEHCYIKGKFLRLINKALEDPRTAISDSTLMSIVSMCICENIRGTNVVTIHLQGLRHMINLRGGINNLPTDQGQYISEMALMQDMMHATCSNVSPIMFDVYPPILRDMRESGIEHWYPQSPLGVVIDTAFLCPSLELQSSSEILKDAFDAFEMLSIEAFDTETGPDQADVFKLRRDKIYGQLAQCEKEMTEELPYTIQEKAEGAIRIAARIHYRAVVLKVQHEDVLNTEDVTRLYAIMRKIEPGFWKVAYHVYLWLALTGGAASCRHPLLRSYFMSEIIRLGLSIGLSDWLSFRQTMGNFLWLQHHLRKGKSPPRIQIR
ncbi:hypothetical protein K504DRAFT_367679 [Pleomassaria siparia CBS 279.74]|uniref:Uncharacterized protein n=1 Tax=Pleomassaria siparia CBS 279.74 TaxID=1314801 RepID=A0A6G1KQY9_9PLEO|nr:hypothetical protein K504DRAFT_367679 [Pleomassaria siparia CBS 279.74]